MKIIDLGNNAIAFEPDSVEDRIQDARVAHLRGSRVSAEIIEIYQKYVRSSQRRADASAPEARADKSDD